MEIVIIGPVFPYKGGIAHDTALMCKALRKTHKVHMLSYKLQYPKFLFKKEQKDYSNKTFFVDEVDYEINTINPFNWIRTAKRINRIKPSVVIIPWWHPYFAPCYWMICKLLKNTKVLFICHNVFPHEHFPLDRFLSKVTLRNGDLFIVHSSQDEKELKTVKASPIYRKTGVPEYAIFKQKDMSVYEARKMIGIKPNDRIILFFGLVREYKGLKYLLAAMPEIRNHLNDVKLFVVGEFRGEKELYDRQIRELGIEDSVVLHDEYVPDDEVERYFQSSDLVVLPYITATQSGVVQIAFSFEKPVVVTNVGGLPEVVQDGITGYVVPPRDSVAISRAVCRFFDSEDHTVFKEAIHKKSSNNSWDDQTRSAVEGLVATGNK
jgi:glycosyltransferase involved in cell wall biosynthesis